MIAWFIAAVLVLIFELFAGTIYLLVVSAALFGAGIAALLFNSPRHQHHHRRRTFRRGHLVGARLD